MSLRYRLAFYLFGLLIGFYFVGEFLSAKATSRGVTFCYFPNCRVIKDIRSKPFKTSAAVDSIFTKKRLTVGRFKCKKGAMLIPNRTGDTLLKLGSNTRTLKRK